MVVREKSCTGILAKSSRTTALSHQFDVLMLSRIMRTTRTLSENALLVAKHLATRENMSLGEAVSELVRVYARAVARSLCAAASARRCRHSRAGSRIDESRRHFAWQRVTTSASQMPTISPHRAVCSTSTSVLCCSTMRMCAQIEPTPSANRQAKRRAGDIQPIDPAGRSASGNGGESAHSVARDSALLHFSV